MAHGARMKFLICFLVILASSLALSAHAHASDFGLVGGNRAFSLKVSSYKAQRFGSVVPQKYDFSCGSAALATLLKFHYETPVDEQEVLDAMYQAGDQQKIKSQGFSLLDMKQYLKTRGYLADGYQLDLQKIKNAGVPGIVLINAKGYRHFVVLKGVSPTHVLLGDPARGIRKLTHGEFEGMWNRIFFVIRNRTDSARLSFNHDDGWPDRRQVLFRAALSDRSLSELNVHTAIDPNIYY